MSSAPFRYSKFGYLALNVTDLEKSKKFYRDVVGLAVSDEHEGVVYLRCGPEHLNVALHRNAEPGLKRLAFELESPTDLEAAAKHLRALGVPHRAVSDAETASLRVRSALRFAIPGCGVPMELFVGMARATQPFRPTVANIVRLGHSIVMIEEFDATFAWLTELFGFVESDHIKADRFDVAFLRCFPNPYHHSLGLMRSERNQFHHVAFMVDDMNDIGRALNRLPATGSEINYGPGRHVASNSIFLYFTDPDGITLEYTLGMEEFAEETPRPPRFLPQDFKIMDMWGGRPQPSYATVGSVERLSL